jgi:hypothetical protein
MDGLHERAGEMPADLPAKGDPATGERAAFVRDRAHRSRAAATS